jgi:hypothetical protein
MSQTAYMMESARTEGYGDRLVGHGAQGIQWHGEAKEDLVDGSWRRAYVME